MIPARCGQQRNSGTTPNAMPPPKSNRSGSIAPDVKRWLSAENICRKPVLDDDDRQKVTSSGRQEGSRTSVAVQPAIRQHEDGNETGESASATRTAAERIEAGGFAAGDQMATKARRARSGLTVARFTSRITPHISDKSVANQRRENTQQHPWISASSQSGHA